MFQKKILILIIFLLLIGFIFKIILTSNGNFLFNIDNARDLVDVREIVVAHKLRLIGPTSAIEGLYNGPAWYYLLAIPFVLSGGHPYSAVLMMIVLWSIGGFFMLKLVSRYGILAVIFAGIVWAFSNYLTLATTYAFNPHPVTLLMPLFIFLLDKYFNEDKGIYLLEVFFLGGLFFNFEMNSGIFMPLIILVSLVFFKKLKFLKLREFWLGVVVFGLALLPQLLFDLKHQFIMTTSVIRYLQLGGDESFDLIKRIFVMKSDFFNVFVPTYFNQKYFVILGLVFLIVSTFVNYKRKIRDSLFVISLVSILVPFIGYILIPVKVNSWHLGPEMAASIILISFSIGVISKIKKIGLYLSAGPVMLVLYFSYLNISDFVNNWGVPSKDPSNFNNEVAAVDYVYKYADNKNFKAYFYLPSVIDYPYQYIVWWRGMNRYGYLPQDYAYLPNKPPYISSIEKFQNTKNIESSGLVFLVKEPDRINQRDLWENSFKSLETTSKEMVGPIEVEVKKENR